MSDGHRRVLVVGSGGREHALALRLLESPQVGDVIVAPGNAGSARPATPREDGKVLRNAEADALAVARRERPDLVVVGPEAPLCAGLADELSEAGLTVYGPSREAARLEGSKAFLKSFAVECGIDTASYRIVSSESELDDAFSAFEAVPVVKADGLCAGKGVIVTDDRSAALSAAREMLSGRAFGEAGRRVVLEERLSGPEVSLHAICDGRRGWLLPLVQDHKRIGDGDTGPNTGGMGTYGPVALPSPSLASHFRDRVLEPVLEGMAKRGAPFRGTLFANLMLVPGRGPMLLEINARFGDPETQVLTNVVQEDWYEVLLSAARGALTPRDDLLSGLDQHALCVILAAPGYPESPRVGDPIEGLDDVARRPGVTAYHAGTRAVGDRVLTAGGRVLGITAVGDTLERAHQMAYEAADAVRFEGKQMRRDIGARAPGIQPSAG